MSKNAYLYKLEAIRAAKELFYPKSVITALKAAKTESEISRIMTTARKNS